ncbi:hypothetical protein ACTXT7_006684 [Hymenolepis weldensis]
MSTISDTRKQRILANLIAYQRAQNKETVSAFVSVERAIQHIPAKSIRNSLVSVEDVRKETVKLAILQQIYRFFCPWKFCRTRDLQKAEGDGTMEEELQHFLPKYRSASHPALVENILGRSVNGSKGERSARSDTVEENSTGKEEIQSEERFCS